jgi:hypothetical protein
MAWLTEVLGTAAFFALAARFSEGQSDRSAGRGLLLVAVPGANRAVYVSCDASHQVAEIGLTDWKVRLIDAGRGADGLAWAPVKWSGAAGHRPAHL